MATFLLDTSVIVDALNNKRNRPALQLLAQGQNSESEAT
jgi:predicted nucleic acid-binding protein